MTPRALWSVVSLHRRARQREMIETAAAARMAHAKANDWKKWIKTLED